LDPTIVLFGFGDVGKNKFTPALKHYLKLCSNKTFPLINQNEELNYLIVDIDENKRKEADIFQKECENEKIPIKVMFFNFNLEKDRKKFFAILENNKVNLTYIASPNRTHATYIDLLLDKSDIILVEKPLVDYKHEIEAVISRHGLDKLAKVRLIDHYLFKDVIETYFKNLNENLEKIGEIQHVEFFLLESKPIRESRKWLYNSGMIRDLGSHFFSILLKHFELGVKEFDPTKFRLVEVKKAIYEEKYIPSDIENPRETFALISLAINGISARTAIGKGVGIEKKQFIIVGDRGTLILDTLRNEIILKTDAETKILYSKEIFRYHEYYNIMRRIFNLDSNIGLSFKMALKEVEILEKTDQFNIMTRYRLGEIPFL